MRLSRIGIGIVSAVSVFCMSVVPALASTSKVTVQPGQSMWKVAHQYGVSLGALEAANPWIRYPQNLLAGTILALPGSGSAAPAAATASNVSSSDLYWMERIINAEAGGQSLQTQIAVGDVILHRLHQGSYGRSIHDVVFQYSYGHYQFTSVANGYIYHTPNASSIRAAEDVLYHHDDVVPGAMVFYNPAQTPAHSWVWSQPRITKIGNLIFAK